MPLWNRLYNTIWLALFSCVMVPRWMGTSWGVAVHALLGLGLAALTVANARTLKALPVPPRLQRISKVTAGIALAQAVLGMALGAVNHLAPGVPVVGTVILCAHVVFALAILSQSSSVATGYDMWEEKEFSPKPT